MQSSSIQEKLVRRKRPLHVLLTILPFLFTRDKKFLFRYFLVGVLIILAMLFDIALPISSKYIVQILSKSVPALTFQVAIVFLSFGLIWTLARVISQFRQITMYRVFERAIRSLGVKLFIHLSKLSMKYHDDRKTGAVINAIDRAQSAIPNVFWGILFVVIPTVIEICIASGILWIEYGVIYGLTLFLVMVIFIMVTLIGIQRAIRYQRIGNVNSQLSASYMVERLTNMTTLKMTLVDESDEIQRCDAILKDREDAMTRQLVNIDYVGIWQILVIGCGLIFLTFYTAQSVSLGQHLHVSDYVLIVGYLVQFATPMGTFGIIFRQIRQGITDLENVVEILDEAPEVLDKPNATALCCTAGKIVFDQVGFNYGDHKIYDDLSFQIGAGKRVAIVGPTGCGKSTLVKLLMRFYDVSHGGIYIDGQDIRSVTQSSLRAAIGVVPQECILFNESIYFNITYPNPKVDRDWVNEIIKLVNLEECIAKLPLGLQTMVGEKGVKLSGGERQRMAIARALLKAPRILIFDEATSSLDAKTENEIQKNLEHLSKNITTMIIAHRLSTVVSADLILVMNPSGAIVERGTHADLMHAQGLYWDMWKEQEKNKNLVAENIC